MRIICLVLLVVGCGVHEEGSDVGFIGYPQIPDSKNHTFLIPKVHKSAWTIGYYFGEDCGLKTNDEKLKLYVTRMLNVWLAPLRDSPLVRRKIVDDFRFQKLQKGRKSKSYYNKTSKAVDLFIEFSCISGSDIRPYASLGKHSPLIVMTENYRWLFSRRDETGYDPFALLHELGHAMGLLDTYAYGNHSIKGVPHDYFHTGNDATIGNNPPSVMSGRDIHAWMDELEEIPEQRRYAQNKNRHFADFIITDDDKKGIEWLYINYFHPNKIAEGNECYFPTHELELLHEDGSRGCVPSNPLIFLVKTGYPPYLIRNLLKKEPALRKFANKREKRGNQLSALHYAAGVAYGATTNYWRPAYTADGLPDTAERLIHELQ